MSHTLADRFDVKPETKKAVMEMAARLLLEKIENPQSEDRTVVLEAIINVRGSSNPNAPEDCPL